MKVVNERYRWSVRWIERLGRIGHALGLRAFNMNREDIIREAKEKTGLNDLGNLRYRGAMDALFDNIEKVGNTSLGKITSHDMGVQACMNRMHLNEYMRRHPEVRSTRIERPVFILGFPRTGTTLIQNLLALSPDRRALPFWEITSPIPLHDDPEKDMQMRMRHAKNRLKVVDFFVPEMRFIHEVRFDSHEECWPLLANSFTVFNWKMSCEWVDYGQYLLDTDPTWAYEEYADFLRVMIHRVPDRKLVLKSPDHLWAVDAILKVFPDAAIVWTHRDPARSVPSYCSLASLNMRVHNGSYNPKTLGPHVQHCLLEGTERALAVRDRVGDAHFYDVDFNDLLKDPKAVIDDITRYFRITPVKDADMDAYLNTQRNDERGNHTYTAERYGLTPEDIRRSFSKYIQRFGLAV